MWHFQPHACCNFSTAAALNPIAPPNSPDGSATKITGIVSDWENSTVTYAVAVASMDGQLQEGPPKQTACFGDSAVGRLLPLRCVAFVGASVGCAQEKFPAGHRLEDPKRQQHPVSTFQTAAPS